MIFLIFFSRFFYAFKFRRPRFWWAIQAETITRLWQGRQYSLNNSNLTYNNVFSVSILLEHRPSCNFRVTLSSWARKIQKYIFTMQDRLVRTVPKRKPAHNYFVISKCVHSKRANLTFSHNIGDAFVRPSQCTHKTKLSNLRLFVQCIWLVIRSAALVSK